MPMRLKTLMQGMRVYMNPRDYEVMIESAHNREAEMACV
ncbi:hypothetical protein SAMN06264855_12149 [Halorubrum vacuolatum]|uniref:Uncharacterized protein n=1 Tax=Halorubrum vacuolatum TaxID=63740 RepID=A0A238XQS2_HALVU|nr:hypothetical protein SAMN06264855_12149 [Halorubrum vacuolatum]